MGEIRITLNSGGGRGDMSSNAGGAWMISACGDVGGRGGGDRLDRGGAAILSESRRGWRFRSSNDWTGEEGREGIALLRVDVRRELGMVRLGTLLLFNDCRLDSHRASESLLGCVHEDCAGTEGSHPGEG